MMEDVDNITLQTLRAVGVNIDEEVHSVSQLSADVLVQATSTCLELIHPELAEEDSERLPRRLPNALSARFNVAHRLAQLVKDDGYKGDLGYQTFLYPNERDSRTLLMFLVERLPKDSVIAGDELLTSSALFDRVVSESIQSDLSAPWLPWYCRPRRQLRAGAAVRRLVVAEAPGEGKLAARVPAVHRQARRENGHSLHRSLLERSADLLAAEQLGGDAVLRTAAAVAATTVKEIRRERGVGQAAVKAKEEAMPLATSAEAVGESEKRRREEEGEKGGDQQEEAEGETREQRRQRQEEETGEARETLVEVERRLERLDAKRDRLSTKLAAAEGSVAELLERYRQLEEEVAAKRKTAEMLPSATDNAAKLDRQVSDRRGHLEAVEAEWATKSAPVMSELAELRAETAGRRALSQRKEAELEEARAALQECTEEARRRDEQLVGLRQKVAKLEAAPNRASYTRRILDIVANIKKQKLEVDRVLGQTRGLQKEINTVSGKLERTFMETDELVFRDARKDDAVRTAYKLLASLHSNYESLVVTEEERGALLREIRELEEQVEGQRRRTQDGQLETVARDCEEMRELNENLKKALKTRTKPVEA